MTRYSCIEEAMSAAGMPAEKIPVTGKIHRFGKKKRLWAVNYGNYGSFGDWQSGISHNWISNEVLIKNTLHDEILRKQQQQKLEREAEYDKASLKAQLIWQKLTDTGQSSYLDSKCVNGYGIKYSKKAIIIPLGDVDSKLWSLQFIANDGQKLFLPKAKIKGCFHAIGNLDEASEIYVAEGYATASSVYMASGQTTLITFNAGNIEPVVAAVRSKYPSLKIIIAADNDQWSNSNTGKDKAQITANKYGCQMILPTFSETLNTHKPTDFNDLHRLVGLEQVKEH